MSMSLTFWKIWSILQDVDGRGTECSTTNGERVRRIRETQTPRMSQEDLAKILELKRTSVTNIESGNQKPTLDTLYLLCERFGLEFRDFMPTLAEVTATEERSVVVGGQAQEVGVKTANLVARLRPVRARR
jgi:transcriptional regulator with XRE-family HTH domain